MLNDINEIRIRYNKELNERWGLKEEASNTGFSIEKLYEMAGEEDRVVTVSFRKGSDSEQIWGSSLTCCFIYTERERVNLMKSIELGENSYGHVRAEDLLLKLNDDTVEKLKTEGFDSKDVVEILVAPQIHPENLYKADEQRTLNQIKIQLEPEVPINEFKFQYGFLCHCLQNGMLLTPSETMDYKALKILLGQDLSENEKNSLLGPNGRINNNVVAARYFLFKSRLTQLSKDELNVIKESFAIRVEKRRTYLDCQLKEMSSSLEKLKNTNEGIYRHIVQESQLFNEIRLNAVGKFPIYLDYRGFIHIGLRHFAEWRFSDYFANKHVFQFPEKDVIQVLIRLVDEINSDYQTKKEQRSDYKYRKFGKNSLYLNGDYYMIHIAADGHVENFSKSVDKMIGD